MKYCYQSEIRNGNTKSLNEIQKIDIPDIIVKTSLQKTISEIL